MPDLSVVIPARNEMFLNKTVESVLAAAQADTEVIAVLDGSWPIEPLEDHPKVRVIHHSLSVGQRAATNDGVNLSRAKYVMKLDAHCDVAKGFDVELINAAQHLGEDVTVVPAQYNLHAFDWVCIGGPGGAQGCGWRHYQGPTPMITGAGLPNPLPTPKFDPVPGCPQCRGEVTRDIIWKPRKSRLTTAWRFDHELHFQYWSEAQRKQKGDFPEIMSCLGACFFMSKARYLELGGMDEEHGSWGQMGTEVACKSWLSGGRMVCDKRTWFAHMFRTQGGDFGFPYPLAGKDVEKARKRSRELWLGGSWPQQKRSLQWLIEHFAPVPGWEEVPQQSTTQSEARIMVADPAPSESGAGTISKGVLYYSDCRGDKTILEAARKRLVSCANGFGITSVTLGIVPLGRNLPYMGERSVLTMFKQILTGLEAMTEDVIFFAEHDILYHPSHFTFTPPKKDAFYYNVNTWKVNSETGQALFYYTKQTSGLCAYRELLLEHYRKRVERVEREGWQQSIGFEPGCHHPPRGIDDYPAEQWMSAQPNIDIRHAYNLTRNRWSQDEFRSKGACRGWTMADEVPGWGRTKDRFAEFLEEATR